MVIDLVLKLFDSSIGILKLKREESRDYFATWIEPIYQNFELLHADYLQSFQNYQNQIIALDQFSKSNPVFDLIARDHLFTQDVRAKITTLTSLFPDHPLAYKLGSSGKLTAPSTSARELDALEKFLWEVRNYYSDIQTEVLHDDHSLSSNFPRTSLLTGLRFICLLDQDAAVKLIAPIVASAKPNLITVKNRSVLARVKGDSYRFAYYFEKQFFIRVPNERTINITYSGLWGKLRSELLINPTDLEHVKKTLAIAVVDRIVLNIQSNYKAVLDSYQELKMKYLK